ncbi:MAG: IS1380 family transposase, partial [Deltaproteobacteria bacterium]|nr:IS1380 family transposase [Deltaproteobacteria bacterium]
RLKERLSETILSHCREPKISHSDIIYAATGLMCLGKPDYDAIEPFRDNPFFTQSLGMDSCPSSATLRQRLEAVKDGFDTILKEESARVVNRTAVNITGVSTLKGELIPLDIDVSPFDNSKTKKEGVSRTYKGTDGFAPIFAYAGNEGYMGNLELREGKQHCQKDTPGFLKSSIYYGKKITAKPLLLRMDSGNDSIDNIKICIKEDIDWLIKRNLRKESLDAWLEIAKENGESYSPRAGKTVWRGSIYRKISNIDTPLRIVFEVTERTIKKGQLLLLPEIAVDTYWTSLEDDPYDVIELYHDHGTSEQYHSEIKSDMDLERLPSEDFTTNALILLIGMLAYNLLRLCGQESLREDNGTITKRPLYRRKAGRRRIRTVIQDLIYMACRVTHHARKVFLSFGRYAPWADTWKILYQRFMIPVT